MMRTHRREYCRAEQTNYTVYQWASLESRTRRGPPRDVISRWPKLFTRISQILATEDEIEYMSLFGFGLLAATAFFAVTLEKGEINPENRGNEGVPTFRFVPLASAFPFPLPAASPSDFLGLTVKKPSKRPCCLLLRCFWSFSAPLRTRSSLNKTRSEISEQRVGLTERDGLESFLLHQKFY